MTASKLGVELPVTVEARTEGQTLQEAGASHGPSGKRSRPGTEQPTGRKMDGTPTMRAVAIGGPTRLSQSGQGTAGMEARKAEARGDNRDLIRCSFVGQA